MTNDERNGANNRSEEGYSRFNDPLAHGPFTSEVVDRMNDWGRWGHDECYARCLKRREAEKNGNKAAAALREKVIDGILGVAVGDALGVPYEFCSQARMTAHPCVGMTGWGTHQQPAGTWSDDTSMTLATMAAFVERDVLRHRLLAAYRDWLFHGKWTVDGVVFDVGMTTRESLESGEARCGENSRGNGSLMRILPAAFLGCDGDALVYVVSTISNVTHGHQACVIACLIYVLAARALMCDKTKSVAAIVGEATYEVFRSPKYRDVRESGRMKEMLRLFSPLMELERGPWMWSRGEVACQGEVVATLFAALWCLMNTNNYRDCVLSAVNLGGDTDTVAAVAGGLAGLMYGRDNHAGIPSEWLGQLRGYELIDDTCQAFSSWLTGGVTSG